MFTHETGYNLINIPLGKNKSYFLREHMLNALLKYSLKEVGSIQNDIHHKNHCKIDNRLENLELMNHGEHSRLHNLNHKRNLGHTHSDESKNKMSEVRLNPILNIRKAKGNFKQGFRYVCEPYIENQKKIKLSSVDLNKCIEKVENFINSDNNSKKYTGWRLSS